MTGGRGYTGAETSEEAVRGFSSGFGAACAVLLLGGMAVAAPGKAMAQNEGACIGLAAPGQFPDTTVASAKLVAANPARKLPAFCEVSAMIRPEPGSNIGVIFRLPEGWNGKFYGIGGGGFVGNLTTQGAAPGLAKGYATAGTDTGHPGTGNADGDFLIDRPGHVNPVELADFGWRAIHLMTTVGKAVTAAYYGRMPTRAYYQGCSTGGREGLTEVQRYPDDYDGVIAGAPVYDLRVQTSALFRIQDFHKDPASNLVPGQAEMINRAVLDACDAADGLKDGIVNNPGACRWDPGVLQCKAGASGAQCLTAKQVAAVRASYAGVKTSKRAVAAWPLARGGELEWPARSIGGEPKNPFGSNHTLGARYLFYFLYGDPDREWTGITPDEAMADLAASPVAKAFQANDPDISRFVKRGGKLLLYHGSYDPGPSPVGTLDYMDKARRVTAAKLGLAPASLDKDMRLFMATGVYHCRGGPGPDQFDLLAAVSDWVENGRAPERIVATKANAPISRPMCVWPALPRYKGAGDPDSEASFACAAPAAAAKKG
jgi:feruloyl esterase